MDDSPLPNEPGIYMLMNTLTRERYVGCAVNIARRVYRHFRELRNGKHINKLLQEAFQRDGEASFVASVLELCPDIRAMPEREHWHIIRRQPEYNQTSTERAIQVATEREKARLDAYLAQNPPTHPPRPISEIEEALLQVLHERAEQRRLQGIERMKNRIID